MWWGWKSMLPFCTAIWRRASLVITFSREKLNRRRNSLIDTSTYLRGETALSCVKLQTVNFVCIDNMLYPLVPPLGCFWVGEVNVARDRAVVVPPARVRAPGLIQDEVTNQTKKYNVINNNVIQERKQSIKINSTPSPKLRNTTDHSPGWWKDASKS